MIAPNVRAQLVDDKGKATQFFSNYLIGARVSLNTDESLVDDGKPTPFFQKALPGLNSRIAIVDDQGRATPFFLKFLGGRP